MRTWADNADEFAALSRQGKDLRLAILVACSVYKGAKGRKAPDAQPGEKCTASQFAMRAGVQVTRVLRHFEAWEALAAEGLVNPARQLRPAHVNDIAVTKEMDMAWQSIKLYATQAALNKPDGGGIRKDAPIKPRPELGPARPLDVALMYVKPAWRALDMVEGMLSKVEHPVERATLRDELSALSDAFERLAEKMGHRQLTD